MIPTYPVILDNTMIFNGTEAQSNFPRTNGRDANGNRLTNIVGFDGVELLKECPHCECTKRSSEFGALGRQTNPQGRRDQSWCKECRRNEV